MTIQSHKNMPEQNKNLKTFKSYMIGFCLALILTLIAFYITAEHSFSSNALYGWLSILALIQLIVQAMCFLRLNAGQEGRWELMPFLFTVLIVVVILGGSLWIMYNLNYFMGS